jgi:hypothetical protein
MAHHTNHSQNQLDDCYEQRFQLKAEKNALVKHLEALEERIMANEALKMVRQCSSRCIVNSWMRETDTAIDPTEWLEQARATRQRHRTATFLVCGCCAVPHFTNSSHKTNRPSRRLLKKIRVHGDGEGSER